MKSYMDHVARGKKLHEVTGVLSNEYWIAWHACRYTAGALLQKAREIGVTNEQLEALRVEASIIAYD